MVQIFPGNIVMVPDAEGAGGRAYLVPVDWEAVGVVRRLRVQPGQAFVNVVEVEFRVAHVHVLLELDSPTDHRAVVVLQRKRIFVGKCRVEVVWRKSGFVGRGFGLLARRREPRPLLEQNQT